MATCGHVLRWFMSLVTDGKADMRLCTLNQSRKQPDQNGESSRCGGKGVSSTGGTIENGSAKLSDRQMSRRWLIDQAGFAAPLHPSSETDTHLLQLQGGVQPYIPRWIPPINSASG